MSTQGGMKAVFAALAANLGIAVTKGIAFAFTGSSSMLSEAIHSLADSGNQALLLIGHRRSKREASQTHPFGYGRSRYVYAFIVAIILFTVGGLFSLYEGFHKLTHPEALTDAWIAFLVLGVAIVLEAFSLRTALREANHARGSRSLWRFIRDVRQPELPVVLLEDIGALAGLFFALFGVSMATITGNGQWDGIGAMAVGSLLVVIAIFLSLEMNAMLIGESALPEEVDRIRQAINTTADSDRVIHLRTLHVGPDELLVVAKIAVSEADQGQSISIDIDQTEARIRAAVPSARYIFLEPDIRHGQDSVRDRSLSSPVDQEGPPAPPLV